MKWPLALVSAALLAMGCRTPAPTFDPFAGRTTVPPPGTGTMAPPAVSQPYYQSAPPPGVPPTTTYPNTVPPGGSYGYPQSSVQPSSPTMLASASAASPAAPRADESRITIAETPAPVTNWSPQMVTQRAADEPTIRIPADDEAARLALPAAQPAQSTRAVAPQTPTRAVAAAPQPVSYAQATSFTPIPQGSYVANGCEPAYRVAPQGAVEITQLPAHTGRSSAAPAASASAAPAAGFAIRPVSHEQPDFLSPVYRYGYDTDYRWIKGKLEYLQSTQQWKLRYIPIDGETDEYGGSVEIANPELMAGIEPGDYVTLHGRITREPDDTSFAPLYTISQAERIE